MSIATRITSITNHLEKDYQALESVVGTISVNKNIENIAPLLDNLYEELPKGTGTGTSLSLSTRAGKMKVNLLGNTSQTGTPTPDNPIPVNVVSGDNEVVVTGKNLLYKDRFITGGTYDYFKFKEDDDNSYYTLSIKLKDGGTSKSMSIGFANGYLVPLQYYKWLMNTGTISGTTQSDGFRSNNNLSSGVYMNYIVVYEGSGNTLQDLFDNYDIQLVKGETYLPYEPYKSQSYPINLPVENLFDEDNAKHYSTNGSGNTTTSIYFNSTDYIPCNANESFTISGIPKTQSDFNFKVVFFDSNKNYISRPIAEFGTIGTRSNFSTTSPSNAKYVMAQFQNNIEEAQFEKGTKANHYTPYGTTPIEMCEIGTYQDKFIRNSGKNLASGLRTGYYNQTTGEYTSNANYVCSKDTIIVKSGSTYQFSIDGAESTGYIYPYDANDNYLGRTATSIHGVYTPNSDVAYFYYTFKDGAIGNVPLDSHIQIEIGSTPTSYEPYGNGNWYLEKHIAKTQVSLDNTVYDIGIYKGSTCQPPNKASLYNGIAYCSKALIATTAEERVENRFYENPANFMFIGSSTDTATTLKEKFDGSDLYYVLATPTYTKITGTLAEQLESVYNAYSYKGTTNINQVNNDLPFELDVSALKDLSGV